MQSPVLSSSDLLQLVFSHLYRREAAQAACVCTAWRAAFTSSGTFRPQLVLALARQARLVDVTDLVLPTMLPTPPLLWGAHTSRPSNTKRAPTWLTSLEFSPYGGRHIFTCQYQAKGITQHRGGTLEYQRRVVSGAQTEEPEGVAFAHNCMYVQNNWGRLGEYTLSGQLLSITEIAGDWVTWAVSAGPDGALYISADKQYSTRVYTEVPESTTGCVLRVCPPAKAGQWGQAQVFTSTPMKRPCGMCWGPTCDTLFVTSLDPCVLRFSGPGHAHPGQLLNRIQLHPEGLVPWDVVILHGTTLVVTMHRHSSVPPSSSTRRKSFAGRTLSEFERYTIGHEHAANHELDGSSIQPRPGPAADHRRGYLCVLENLGDGPSVTVICLPNWMDHANMMCVAD